MGEFGDIGHKADLAKTTAVIWANRGWRAGGDEFRAA